MELCAFKRNNFILYKLIPCLLIIMFSVMCLYGSKVYASFEFSFNDTYYSLPNLPSDFSYNNFIIAKSTSGETYQLFLLNLEDNYDSHDFYISTYNQSPTLSFKSGIAYRYRLATSPIASQDLGISYESWEFVEQLTGNYGNPSFSISDLLYSSINICDINGDVVFQAPSQTRTIVASQVGEVEMNKTLQEILGILPVVIVVLVGLIAIRKGILFLMARMKKV